MRARQLWVALGLMAMCGTSLLVAVGLPSPSTAATEIHLTAAGDYGAGPATANVLDLIAQRSPDAHLALGDLSYGHLSPESTWCRFVKDRVGEDFPFQLVSGNHESLDNNDGDINDFSACLPNQIPGIVGVYGREYYMDLPKSDPIVRVIQVAPFLTFDDGRWSYAQGDAHFQWLSAAIDEGRARGADWIVVTSHYPCQTMGANGCQQPKDFYDLLAAKRVDLVLHGHDHSYARTHQLSSGIDGCSTIPAWSFDADCVVDSDNDYAAGQGSVFATVGRGGVQLRDVNPSDSEAGYFAAWSGQNANPTHGVLDVVITEGQLSARFLGTPGGSFTDSFTITKGETPPTTTVGTTTTTVGTTTTTVGTTTTTAPPGEPTMLAEDTFDRSVVSGWGTAATGGPWTASPLSAFSVDGEAGQLTISAGNARTAHLRQVSSSATNMLVTLASDKVPTGSGLYTSVAVRSVDGVGEYRAVVRVRADGVVTLRLDRGTSTISPEIAVPGIRYSPGLPLNVRVTATGTSPTTITASVWEAGTAEPSTPLRSATDNGSGMQVPGSVGLYLYLSSSAANGPVTVSVDDLAIAAG